MFVVCTAEACVHGVGLQVFCYDGRSPIRERTYESMDDESDAVRAATVRFYDAIEAMASGKGIAAMKAAWHHTPRVTSRHPSGGWARGWDEVWVTWELLNAFGRADRGGGKLEEVEVQVYGDIAYATTRFTSAPAWGAVTVSCTNVLQRVDGEWKLLHHHADSAPEMGAALERMLEEDA